MSELASGPYEVHNGDTSPSECIIYQQKSSLIYQDTVLIPVNETS
jgi:hypothetical protein